jgi:hypothetical protein
VRRLCHHRRDASQSDGHSLLPVRRAGLAKALEGRWAKVHLFEADPRAGLSGPPFESQSPFETELRTSATRPTETSGISQDFAGIADQHIALYLSFGESAEPEAVMRRLRWLAILAVTTLCPIGAAMPVNVTVYTLEPVTILFINPHKDLQLTLSGTINLDTSAGRPYAENVPADVTVDVESSEPPGAPFLPYYSDVITTAGDKLDGESISLLGPPNAQLFVSIPLFSYPYPLNFTGTMLVIAEPSSALNVFDGDTTQVTFVASPSIPEPPSLLLLAGGFGFLALRRALAGGLAAAIVGRWSCKSSWPRVKILFRRRCDRATRDPFDVQGQKDVFRARVDQRSSKGPCAGAKMLAMV